MGTFEMRIGVSNGNGGNIEWVQTLVDTGATYTVLPESLLRGRIGIQPKEHRIFTFADGRETTLPIGEARLHIGDRDTFNPVVFGTENQFLLGATALQTLGLIPDTTNHRLIPAPKLLV